MSLIYINGKQYHVNKSKNLLHTCISIGLDIPYFCWHPALGSVGACRQCAVKQFSGLNSSKEKGRIVMSCMTPIVDQSYFVTNDNEIKKFRKKIIECLMINHPHDCPVCMEGGNCHLQDMTVLTKHIKRQYRFTKKTYYNQYLGPFLSHEMNRCISCYRCVRYYKYYADGSDFGVYGSRDRIYFGRINDGILENEFSGNLIEICPTGVFTDKTHLSHYSRKWDMQFAPSICHQCSVGCNISPGERYGKLQRIENRYNKLINHYFLCDRGRFGYGYANLKNRPYHPKLIQNNQDLILSDINAIEIIANIFKKNKRIIGIGSPRASIESNYALRKLVGSENFFSGISDSENDQLKLMINILKNSGIYTPTLSEIEDYDSILIIGEDLTQTSARIALAIRQAVKGKSKKKAQLKQFFDWQTEAVLNIGQNEKYPLFSINLDTTKLEDISTISYYASIENQARFAFFIAHVLDKNSPKIDNFPKNLENKAKFIASKLLNSKKTLIISGNSLGNRNLIEASANIALSLKSNLHKHVAITYVSFEANSFGIALMNSKSLNAAIKEIELNKVDVAIIMENDLYRRNNTDIIDQAFKKLEKIIVADHIYTPTMKKADLILPAANFSESSGTLINNELRAQRYFQVFDPNFYRKNTTIHQSWRWFYSLKSYIKFNKINWSTLDTVIDDCIKSMPQFSKIKNIAPNSKFRINGQKLTRSPHCYSGRTSMLSNIDVNEPGQPKDLDTPFAFSMEGNNNFSKFQQYTSFPWSPGWNSPQAWIKLQNNNYKKKNLKYSSVRLFDYSKHNRFNYFLSIPPLWKAKQNEWVIVPYYHLFGSDETSQLAPAIKENMKKSYVVLNVKDATNLNINQGELCEFNYRNQIYQLPIQISSNLEQGQIGLPLGMPNLSPSMLGLTIKKLRRIISK